MVDVIRKKELKNMVFLNDENFQEFIQDDKLTLLFFMSGMHLQCRQQMPAIRIFAENYGERYNVAVIDATRCPIAVRACGVDGLPYLVITRRGIVLGGRRGGMDSQSIDVLSDGGCCDDHHRKKPSDNDFLQRLDVLQQIDIEKHLKGDALGASA